MAVQPGIYTKGEILERRARGSGNSLRRVRQWMDAKGGSVYLRSIDRERGITTFAYGRGGAAQRLECTQLTLAGNEGGTDPRSYRERIGKLGLLVYIPTHEQPRTTSPPPHTSHAEEKGKPDVIIVAISVMSAYHHRCFLVLHFEGAATTVNQYAADEA
ncbi:hypothetical protein BDQ17DRAFT_1415499 [Cyathus striatus]|nr:hypothetical protein BDQ17DRAFT_1415499 [Cyathus striatus]